MLSVVNHKSNKSSLFEVRKNKKNKTRTWNVFNYFVCEIRSNLGTGRRLPCSRWSDPEISVITTDAYLNCTIATSIASPKEIFQMQNNFYFQVDRKTLNEFITCWFLSCLNKQNRFIKKSIFFAISDPSDEWKLCSQHFKSSKRAKEKLNTLSS